METTSAKYSERRSIDLLVSEFWRLGYLTISRRFGTYLPEPTKVGVYPVDIIGRNKSRYAIGIAISIEEFKDQDRLLEKIKYLATRRTKYSKDPVQLFLGIPAIYFNHSKEIIKLLSKEVQKNIKLVKIAEKNISRTRKREEAKQVLFS